MNEDYLEEPRLTGKLVSLQVGKPTRYELEGENWRTAIYKGSLEGRIALRETNLDGDRQANTRFHGGPDKAVCCFCMEHYPHWRERLERGDAFSYGAFGENFTLQGLTEDRVCLGDTYAIGTAKVQVTQPRQPCFQLARKWDSKTMPQEMIERGDTGYYLRVLQTGEVGAGDSMTLLERPYADLTIACLNAARYRHEGGAALALRLFQIPEISEEWRRAFEKRIPESFRS